MYEVNCNGRTSWAIISAVTFDRRTVIYCLFIEKTRNKRTRRKKNRKK